MNQLTELNGGCYTVSDRDLAIYNATIRGDTVIQIAKFHKITSSRVYQILKRINRILGKTYSQVK
jgi:DNA-binding CsgD family transcriptional regulator